MHGNKRNLQCCHCCKHFVIYFAGAYIIYNSCAGINCFLCNFAVISINRNNSFSIIFFYGFNNRQHTF